MLTIVTIAADMAAIKNLVYYKCDITDREAVVELAARIAKEHGHPSILVNNAGVANAAPILKVTDKQLKQLFDVNIISHYYTIQAFMPNMIKENKGHIFSTASVASFMAAPGLVPYSNTKASVLALHEGLSFETRAVWKAPSIKFSIIHPTFIDTAMAAPFKTNLNDAGAGIITPESVANAAVKQILSCRSGQIILSGNLGALVNVRKWPKWMYYGAFYLGDKRTLVSILEMISFQLICMLTYQLFPENVTKGVPRALEIDECGFAQRIQTVQRPRRRALERYTPMLNKTTHQCRVRWELSLDGTPTWPGLGTHKDISQMH
jgi:NAD(P)-dependent dehydrogenase (short-subunit alcohol dehydrogenase family)